MTKEDFILKLEKLNIFLTEEQLMQLEKFYELLVTENEKLNLTRIINKEDVYLKHFYDSLTINKAIDLDNNLKLCDIGSGAGFPGLVLKIVFPKLNIVLLDARKKRVDFLNKVIKTLNLEDIIAIHSRAEDYKGRFDIVTARAVSSLDNLLKYGMHLLGDNGILIAMKANIEKDLEVGEKALKKGNAKIVDIISFKLPIEESTRNLIIIEKENIEKN